MMPAETLVLGLADASRHTLSPHRSNRSKRGSTLLGELRRRVDLAVRSAAEPWMPRVSANYPY
jgi:hypothetical protein